MLDLRSVFWGLAMRFRSKSRSITIAAIVIFVTSYLLLAKLCQLFALSDERFGVIWLPSGIALAALFLFGRRYWPVIWLASFLAYAFGFVEPVGTQHLLTATLAGFTDTLEAVLGALLLTRFIGVENPCNRPGDAFKFAIFSGAASCAIGAILNTALLASMGGVRSEEFVAVGTTHWLSHTVGILVMTPVIFGWAWEHRIQSTSKRVVEVAVMWFVLVLAAEAVFGGWVRSEMSQIPIISLAVLLLLWSAIRFSQRTAATATLVLSAIVIWGSVRGFGPLACDNGGGSVLVLQGFVGVMAVSSLGMAADVALRRQIGRGLYRYKTTSLQTADHWMISDVKGIIEEVNPSFERITGFSQEELLGRPASFLKSGYHDTAFYENMWRTILAGEPYRGVVVNKKKTGELFHEIKTITPIKDDEGRITHFLSIGKDITDLKLAEEELRGAVRKLELSNSKLLASEEAVSHQLKILESVFNSMKEGVIVADSHGKFVMFNNAATEMVGVGLTDSEPRNWPTRYGVFLSDMVTQCPVEELPLYRAIQGYETDEKEIFIRNPLKEEGVWLRITGRPIRQETGELRGGVIVTRDVTQQKRAEKAEKELEATRAEFEAARTIQTRFFPKTAPELSVIDIGGASRPAVATGGDYFDYFTLPDGGIALIVGDVSGHGLGPALIMASVRAYLHALAQSETGAEDVLTILNRLIVDDTGTEDFVTLIYAKLDPETGFLDYVSAGHTTCYVLDHAGDIKASLESTGPPLGVVPDAGFDRIQQVALESGDIVLLLTDGIIEAECQTGDVFGPERAIEFVRRNRNKKSKLIVDELLAEVDNCCEEDTQDDITSIVIKVG
jgi:sigma-B regulation protein RsbU (phosphoserine phosphatase)